MTVTVQHTAQETIHAFKSFLGKPRPELPWLNGKTHGFPNRIKGFYDCALAVSFFLKTPVMTMCHQWRDYCLHNKTWHTNFNGVQPGDIVIFDWESKKGIGKNTNTDHIGIVVHADPKKKTVTYVSADTGKVIPGIVTLNTVGATWITGFGRPVAYAAPVVAVPVVHPEQAAAHAAPAPASVAV